MKLKNFIVAIILGAFAFVGGDMAFDYFGDGSEISGEEQNVTLDQVDGFVGTVKESGRLLKENVKALIEEYIKRDK